MRPVTVGIKTGRVFHRSEKMALFRGSLQNSGMITASAIADDMSIPPEEY